MANVWLYQQYRQAHACLSCALGWPALDSVSSLRQHVWADLPRRPPPVENSIAVRSESLSAIHKALDSRKTSIPLPVIPRPLRGLGKTPLATGEEEEHSPPHIPLPPGWAFCC